MDKEGELRRQIDSLRGLTISEIGSLDPSDIQPSQEGPLFPPVSQPGMDFTLRIALLGLKIELS